MSFIVKYVATQTRERHTVVTRRQQTPTCAGVKPEIKQARREKAKQARAARKKSRRK